MDTKPLERFATWARRELLTVVDAQASAVLVDGSVARSERPDVVRRLESEIERHGRQHVIDKVAYTWFNRIIALRFMDARGYTNAGIVSPAKGQEHGQPEILADAKRGNLDRDVITSTRAADAILGLLDGSRHSTDAEGEAYALLLTEYCRHWHKSMPFMFEREGDYAELLVPANLLADGAILSRAREALTEDVCQDVEVIGWLYQFYISERKDEVFAGFKNNKKAGSDEIPAATQLFTPHWIVRYLVENSLGRLWMLNHPESRLVDQMDYYIAPVDKEADFLRIGTPEELTVIDPACGSGHMLTYAFDLLYAIYEEEGYAPAEISSLILTHNLYGTEIDPRAGALAAFALTMKARSRRRALFTKQIEPKICVIEPICFEQDELNALVSKDGPRDAEVLFWNQFANADTVGALVRPDRAVLSRLSGVVNALGQADDILLSNVVSRAQRVLAQATLLSSQYAAIVANPPYMGRGNMNPSLVKYLKDTFRDGSTDLYSAFMSRALTLAAPNGMVGMVTMETWMFLGSFENLRRRLLNTVRISSLVHMPYLGKGGTSMGISFGTSAWIIEVAPPTGKLSHYQCVRYFETNLTGVPTEFPVLNERRRNISQENFLDLPNSAIAYWIPKAAFDAYKGGDRLSDVAYGQPGLQSSNNSAFLRYWWEVSQTNIGFGFANSTDAMGSARRWFPHLKGGSFRRWYGNEEYVVDWESNGSRIKNYVATKYPYLKGNTDYVIKDRGYFFRPMISYTRVTSGRFSARSSDAGFVFDVTGSALFPSHSEMELVLGFLNSTVGEEFLKAQNSSMAVQAGDIDALPFSTTLLESARDRVVSIVSELVGLLREDWNSREQSWNFRAFLTSERLRTQKIAQFVLSQGAESQKRRDRAIRLERENNEIFREAYEFPNDFEIEVDPAYVSFGTVSAKESVSSLVSYGIGCIFGRYSLDETGLILADQGATLQNYSAKVPSATFTPDADNVIPFVDDGWFEDDIVERFRQFLRAAFGSEHFEENLRFVEESLEVKAIRDYFITKNGKSKFYDDHLQRYKKRPIYWMFSSPKGSFNALVYMHRYMPSTVSTVLNEYLREYRAKLEVALADAENAAAGGSIKDQKEADRLRKVLVELAEYEHDVLYPLATRQLPIDLDDGVLVNYLRFGRALKDIGLEKDRRKVEGWTWPRYPLEAAQ